ncbi:ABC transporter ATP-binding protein [Treponema porcinum]|uniref:ABC transporter ATP-binding protein n=1 Tax=Treponema porcinum TaxID=261392 RepID=UPI003F06162D
MSGRIQIENLSKVFGENESEKVVALDGVTAEIPEGSFVSLIGPSGCGKTTLLRCIAGLEVPTSGTVTVDGEKVTKTGSDRGFAFQQANLFPWLSIKDNISFGLRARGIYKQRKGDVQKFINLVGLSGFEKSYPHQLSGGMNQRASLARALVGHPKILLLDEPLGALDAFTRMTMQDEILRIRQENSMTMVMVTHDVDEAVYLSDYIIVMTPRPAKVEKIIKIEMSHPRARSQDVFLQYRTEILKILNYAGKINEVEYSI